MDKLLDLTQLEGHTPGPWYPGCHTLKSTCKCRWILCEKYAGSIATVDVSDNKNGHDGGNCSPPEAEAIANAKLIASAPALLAENRRLRDKIESMQASRQKMQAEMDQLRADLKECVDVLRKLTNEACAWAGDCDCSEAMGRTNTLVLDERIKAARALLARLQPAEDKP